MLGKNDNKTYFVESVEANDLKNGDDKLIQLGKKLVAAFYDKSNPQQLKHLVDAGAPVNYRLDYGLEIKFESDFVAQFLLLLEGDKGHAQLLENAKKLLADETHAKGLVNYVKTGLEFFETLHAPSANQTVFKLNPDFAEFLLTNAVEARSNPDHANGSLSIAVGIGETELVKQIIAKGEVVASSANGAGINFRGYFDDNAAVWATILLDEENLRQLLNKKSDFEGIGITKSSLLHWVSVASRLDQSDERSNKALSIAKLLLSYGASPTFNNKLGLSPLDYAKGNLLDLFKDHLQTKAQSVSNSTSVSSSSSSFFKAVDFDCILQVSSLSFAHKPLVDESVAKILRDNNIKLKLNYYDSDKGNTSKPIMLFIHGNSSSQRVFKEQIQHYSKQYRIIALDLMGHGKSSKIEDIANISETDKKILSEAFYSPCGLIAEVKQLLEMNNLFGCHIVGWSLGGHIAYGLAVENPALVASIVTIGSPPVKFSTEGFKQGFGDWFRTVLLPQWINDPKKIPYSEAAALTTHMGFKSTDTFFAEDMMKTDPQIRRCLFLHLNEYDAPDYSSSGLDAAFFVQTTDIPVCLLVGSNDAGINANYIGSLKNKLKNQNSQVMVIENGAHALFSSNSKEYFEIVDQFILQANKQNSLELS